METRSIVTLCVLKTLVDLVDSCVINVIITCYNYNVNKVSIKWTWRKHIKSPRDQLVKWNEWEFSI